MTFPSFSFASPAALPVSQPVATLPPEPVSGKPLIALRLARRLQAADKSFASPTSGVARWRPIQLPAAEVHRVVERFLFRHPQRDGHTARQIFKAISQTRPDIPLKRVHNACHNLAERGNLLKTPATNDRPMMGFRLTSARRDTLRGIRAVSRAVEPIPSRQGLLEGWAGYLRSSGIDSTAESRSEVAVAFLKSRAVHRHDRCTGTADVSAEYLTGFLAVQKFNSAIVCLYGRPTYLQAWRDAQGVWQAQPLPPEDGAAVTTLECALKLHLRAVCEEPGSEGKPAVHVVAFDAH